MDALQKPGIAYVHFSNDTVNGQSIISTEYLRDVRQRFKNIIIIAGGFSAEKILQSELVDLVAFGKLYISNPDLIERIRHNAVLTEWNEETFYQSGDEGYIDYPTLSNP